MPQTKAAKKDLKQSKKKAIQNLKVKRSLKKTIKQTEEAINSGKGEVKDLLHKSQKALDKAAKKGLIKRKNASRKISRLAKAAKKRIKK